MDTKKSTTRKSAAKHDRRKTGSNSRPTPPDADEEDRAWVVRRSRIHNKGMFARRAIASGERIIEYLGEKITKAESNRRGLARHETAQQDGSASVYIFELNKRYDIDGDVPWNPAKYANHSCEPNCEVENIRGRLWMIALRDIEKGEELTYDYGYDLEHFLEHPCRCGAPSCVGYIVSSDSRRKLKRILARSKRTSKA